MNTDNTNTAQVTDTPPRFAEELQRAFMDDDDPDSEWHMGDTAALVTLVLVIVSLALVGLWTVFRLAAGQITGGCG